MNLGNVRMAVALTATLERLPDSARVLVETGIGETVELGHMRSTEEGDVVFSILEMPED